MALARRCTLVFCKTQFIGFHYWEGAPDDVSHLRARHRHVFHVLVEVQVSHDNRNVEFQTLRRQVDRYLSNNYADDVNLAVPQSCEMIGSELAEHLTEVHGYHVRCVTVSEDDENGAELLYE